MLGAPGDQADSSRSSARMRAAARLLNRRSVILVVVLGTFLGTLLIASQRLGELCADATYCPNLSDIQSAIPFRKPKTPDHDDAPAPSTTPVPNFELNVDVDDDADSESLVVDETVPDETNPGDDVTEPAPQVPAQEQDETAQPEPDMSSLVDDDDAACAGFPDTSRILLVMKTGASEAYSKVPTQVLTNLRCIDDFLIFSDMAQQIAGYTIHDSLDTVPDDVKDNNQDFDLYRNQASCMVDQASCNKNHDVASQGWALDKYKNIHIAEKTYKLHPHRDWYLFVDADTYVVWSTLVEWLATVNHDDPQYLGSRAYLGSFPFGHGGSGYLVSNSAMKNFFEGKENVANKWDAEARETCCGDYMFAYALKNETDLEVQNMWPTINGEKPYTMPYGPSQWCHPIATMHHIGSEEVSSFDAFEQERNYTSPMRIKDLYHRFVSDKLEPHRTDWDNMSNSVIYLDASEGHHHEDWQVDRAKKEDLSEIEEKAHLSFDDCRRACLADWDCFQYSHHDGVCTLEHSFIYGHPRTGTQDGEVWMSGWDVEKIRTWVAANEECGDVVWPSPE